jgi:predicted DNA-binding transcriptional regulator AlpA
MSPLLSQADLSRLLGLSQRTLERMRLQGNGPRYCKLGGSVRYREEDLAAWINSRVVNSTSEEINQ